MEKYYKNIIANCVVLMSVIYSTSEPYNISYYFCLSIGFVYLIGVCGEVFYHSKLGKKMLIKMCLSNPDDFKIVVERRKVGLTSKVPVAVDILIYSLILYTCYERNLLIALSIYSVMAVFDISDIRERTYLVLENISKIV